MKFSSRMNKVKKSYIREILKITEQPDVISFAGGLPNSETFPVNEILKASKTVLEFDGENALQYSTTEGYAPLRKYICDRYYKRFGLEINENEILITTGSQQGLDLIGKIFLNSGDGVIIEKPGYLGAIQSLSIFEPEFIPVELKCDGVNIEELKAALDTNTPKLYYAVPNFQNPSGLTYSEENLKQVANLLKLKDTVFIADDPYSELRYDGKEIKSMKSFMRNNIILLGSFSKIVSPSMRIGWICADSEIMEKLVIVKQAADLHTSYFTQRILYQYLVDNDLDEHISRIKALYKKQRDVMLTAMRNYFPKQVEFTVPEGGMFLWVTLPKNISAINLLKAAEKEKVAFVPGDPFYVNADGINTLRLNYTNSQEDEIIDGIKKIARVIDKVLKNNESF